MTSLFSLFTDFQGSNTITEAMVTVVSTAFPDYENVITGLKITFLQSSTPLFLLPSSESLWLFDNQQYIATTVNSSFKHNYISTAHKQGIIYVTHSKVVYMNPKMMPQESAGTKFCNLNAR